MMMLFSPAEGQQQHSSAAHTKQLMIRHPPLGKHMHVEGSNDRLHDHHCCRLLLLLLSLLLSLLLLLLLLLLLPPLLL
jgi:hypothetical protein